MDSLKFRLLALALMAMAVGTVAKPTLGQPVEASVVRSQCTDYARRIGAIGFDRCLAAQLRLTGATSSQGRPILLRDIAANAAEDRLRVLVLGTIHGDELTAPVLAFRWLQFASQQTAQASSAATERTSARVAWRFVPVVNPDGLLATPATRVNARGIDLNRNFPTPNWQQEAPRYWEQRTRRDPRRFPGRSPLSEPESRFIEQQLDAFSPDLIVSIHAPLGVLDFDGPAVPPHRLGRLYLDQVGVFPGSLGHYAGVHRGIPVVTIELPHALRAPTDAEMRHMWDDLLRWIDTRLLTRPDERLPPVQTASPMPAFVSPIQQLLPSPLQPVLVPLKAR